LTPEHVLLHTQAGLKADLFMSDAFYAVLGHMLLGGWVVLSLFVVGHLARLKVADLRKQRRMADQGARFGLIREVVATGRPRVKPLAGNSNRALRTSLNAPGQDRNARRWTIPIRTGGYTFQWN
jgi:hypothetical protein